MKFLPFEPPHLVKGKDIDSLHVAKSGGKLCELTDVIDIVRQPRNKHVTEPYWTLRCPETTCKLKNRLQLHSRKSTMYFRIPTFDIEQDEIDGVQFLIGQTMPQTTVCVESSMDAHRLSGPEQLDGEAILHERFATAQRKTT